MNSKIWMGIACAGIACAANADVTFTSVKPPPGSELGHRAILNNLYGGSFAAMESGRDFTNGDVTVLRYADYGVPGPLALAIGGVPAADQDWSGSSVRVQARAKYAGDRHTFGWIDDTAESPSYSVIGSTSNFSEITDISVSESFRWAINDLTTGTTWTSRPSDNVGPGGTSYDQLVTYRVYGVDPEKAVWLLFWEDRIGAKADYDYNDAVIELRTAEAVPAPGALGLCAAAGIVGGRRRRR